MGQERVYVSTDKDVYVAGEDIWYSVYCMEGDSGKYSGLSDVAYLQFVSNDGVAATSKVALIDGRGAGRFRIPFSFATGNYSIVSFTRSSGGDSKGEFNGKVISVEGNLKAKGGESLNDSLVCDLDTGISVNVVLVEIKSDKRII